LRQVAKTRSKDLLLQNPSLSINVLRHLSGRILAALSKLKLEYGIEIRAKMASWSGKLRNIARGGGTFHKHRLNIVRGLLEATEGVVDLSNFLRDKLLKLSDDNFHIFNFSDKDWELCERLLLPGARRIEPALLSIAALYVEANKDSVGRLYALNRALSGLLLQEGEKDFAPKLESIKPVDTQSLFSIRIDCALHATTSDLMRQKLETRFPSKSWARVRLTYPLLHCFLNHPVQANFDNFLSYMVTGRERETEKLAIKLLLSDEAARTAPLAFKIFVGLMGHAYDVCEIILDHVEQVIAEGKTLDESLLAFLVRVDQSNPCTRAARIINLVNGNLFWRERPDAALLQSHIPISKAEAENYSALFAPGPTGWEEIPDAESPYAIILNMRSQQYPDPLQFQRITSTKAIWFFTDGARLLGALLRSIYMVDRVDRDLEVRDAMRLIQFAGCVTAMIAGSASGMQAVRMLNYLGVLSDHPATIERNVDLAFAVHDSMEDRFWIIKLQWTLRKLEEVGRIEDWLRLIRMQTKLKPAFLTGINFNWVDEVVAKRRLAPFRSFDGAYLLLLSVIEAHGDPLRLRLVLEPLLAQLDYKGVVEKVIQEFGSTAPAIIRNYLTTQNVLSSGLASNYVAALDQRVTALEDCLRRFGYGPLLTEEIYEGETRALMAELLLTSVNTGKFEIPWETFRSDAIALQSDLYLTVQSLKSISDEDPRRSALTEHVIQFPNGRSQHYRVRIRQSALFALITALLDTFMQHPAFGLEVILSGRFRHNNLLHELWSAIAGVSNATIASVPPIVTNRLIEDYKLATEGVLDQWSSTYLQSRRPQRPDGLFDLIPEQSQMEELLIGALQAESMSAIVDVVIVWLKDQLRLQVEVAKTRFSEDVPTLIAEAFEEVKLEHQARANLRPQDVQLVNVAVTDATRRRVVELSGWFSGVDATSNACTTLPELITAVATLFENVIKDRNIHLKIDSALSVISFGPKEVKIAFDLLRETLTNALRHGIGPIVPLDVQLVKSGALWSIKFANPVETGKYDDSGTKKIAGSRFTNRNEALFREKGSGLAKVAALASTLCERDVEIERSYQDGRHLLIVPIRANDSNNSSMLTKRTLS
jgi:hypothetical protein